MKRISTLLFIFISVNLFSQTFSYQLYGNKEGLQGASLLSLTQDKNGYIWTGGNLGLNKFDGLKFKNYNTSDGLVNDRVMRIYKAKNNIFWLATRNGVSKFDGKNFTNYTVLKDSTFDNKTLFGFIETKELGFLGFGMNGVVQFKNKSFEAILPKLKAVKEILDDNKGNLWIGSNKGLFTYAKGKLEEYKISNNVESNNITCMAFAKDGSLWMGLSRGIAHYYNGKIDTFYTNTTEPLFIRDVIYHPKYGVIFISNNLNIYFYKNNKFTEISLKPFMLSGNLLRIIVDKEGLIWIATTSGLLKLMNKPFNYSPINTGIKDPIFGMCYDNNNKLFLSTNKGLYTYQNGVTEFFQPSKNDDDNYIIAVAKADSGIYVGSHSGKVYKFCNNKFRTLDTLPNIVFKILPINNSEVWFLKNHYIIHLKNGLLKKINLLKKNSNRTNSGIKDKKGKVWFVNYDGLFSYENDVFKEYGEKEGLNFKCLVSISNDNFNNIWIGTRGYGIIKYDGKTFTQINQKNGLVNNFIVETVYDSLQNIVWASTMCGISKIVLNKNGEINKINNYTANNDMEVDGFSDFALLLTKENTLLAGVSNGLLEFKYQNDKEINKITPSLQLENIRLFYENVDFTNYSDSSNTWNNIPYNLVLPYNKNYVTFDFVGISSIQSDKVSYKYMLTGLDENYSPPVNENSCTYQNLKPGTYTFKLLAANADGIWTSQPLTYTFTITPPYYNTWWFYSICVILIIATSYLLYNYKINQLKKQQVQKLKQLQSIAESELKAIRSQLNPHFMFNVLSAIQDVYLDKDEEKAQLFIAEFASLMRGLLQNSSKKEISLEEEIEFIKKYIELEKIRLGDKFQYEIQIDEAIDPTDTFIPPMLLQPFIENAINHGLLPKQGKGLLTINFTLQNTSLCITIIDNGIGRKASALRKNQINHSSMAITLIKERLEILSSMNDKESYTYVITDLTEGETAIGTRVMITLPKN